MRNLPMRNLPTGSATDRDEWLSAYVDDELSPADRQRVETWLATDPQWQDGYQRLMRLSQGFRGLKNLERQALGKDYSTPVPPLSVNRWFESLTRGMMAATALGGMGIAFVFVTYFRDPLLAPMRVEATPTGIPIAAVPAPLNQPSSKPIPSTEPSHFDRNLDSSAGTIAPVMVSNTDHSESGLTVALDQPIFVFPPNPVETQAP